MFDGKKMREVREAAGMSQVQLAERLGYTKQMISLIEKGREPKLELAALVANELGHPLDYFLK